MHIDGLMDACRAEWKDTVSGAIDKAIEFWDEGASESTDRDDRITECVQLAMDWVAECIDYQEAVAYMLESGLIYDALRGDISYDNCPFSVMESEVYEGFTAALEERDEQ